jgi:1,4-dihydroxy-6-naphthoate synthase
VERLIRQSLEYSFASYPVISDYVKQHSQTMSEDVMRQHIELYVNNFSSGLGEEGKNAIKILHEVFNAQKTNRPVSSSSQLFLS